MPIYEYIDNIERLTIIEISMPVNLLDMMTQKDQETVRAWAEERMAPKHPQDIPIPYYTMAELGHYYGWQAVVDLKRGYHSGITDEGKPRRVVFTFEEANALIKAMQKLQYNLGKSTQDGR